MATTVSSGMNLVLIKPDEVDPTGRLVLADERAAHILRALSGVAGHKVRIGMLEGPLGVGTIVSVAEGVVGLQCRFDDAIPPKPSVDLLLALPRPKVMRRLWAQCAALGVGRIALTNAARVERNYFDSHVLTPECYGPLLVEGLQHARDTRLPSVSIHRQFRVLVEDQLDELAPDSLRLVAQPSALPSISDTACGRGGQRVLLAVGPVGGWDAFELKLLDLHGFIAVGLGPRALRSDTACVALLALVHQALRHRTG